MLRRRSAGIVTSVGALITVFFLNLSPIEVRAAGIRDCHVELTDRAGIGLLFNTRHFAARHSTAPLGISDFRRTAKQADHQEEKETDANCFVRAHDFSSRTA